MSDDPENSNPSVSATGFGDNPPENLGFQCSVCERSFKTEGGLKRHVTVAHLKQHSTESETETEGHTLLQLPDGKIIYKAPNHHLQRIGDALISNIAVIGTMASIAAPHTGLTILTRAPLLGKGLMEVGSKNEQVMAGIIKFNTLFTGGELGTAVVSIGVALTVDVGMVKADGKLATLLIGDVVKQVEAMRLPAEDEE